MKTIYASDLGHCYAKTEDGRFRAFKDGNLFRIYFCGREMLWSADNEFLGYGKRVTANGMIYFRHLNDFQTAVYECEQELRYLAASDA